MDNVKMKEVLERMKMNRPKFPKRAVVTAGMPYGSKNLHYGHVCGMMVYADFFARFLKDKLGKENVLFVMMGSMGYGNLDAIIDEIDGCDIDFEVAVVCGNNSKARDMILAKNLKHKFHAYGFINNVDEFMDAADCIITKPGGLTVTESMAKHLPMILVDPIPGQENRNVEFLVNNGVALYVWNHYGLGNAINIFYNNDIRRGELLTALSRMAKPGAVSDLGNFILSSGKEKKQK